MLLSNLGRSKAVRHSDVNSTNLRLLGIHVEFVPREQVETVEGIQHKKKICMTSTLNNFDDPQINQGR